MINNRNHNDFKLRKQSKNNMGKPLTFLPDITTYEKHEKIDLNLFKPKTEDLIKMTP